MARGRFLSKSLSTSRKFADLHPCAGERAEFCQTLYCLLVAHADDFGRFDGDPFTIKHEVVPTSPRTIDDVAQALAWLDGVKLIVWYEGARRDVVRSQKIVQIVGFDEHQQGLHKRRESWLEAPGSSGNFREVPGNSGLKREHRRSKREERRLKQDPAKNRDRSRSKRDPQSSKEHALRAGVNGLHHRNQKLLQAIAFEVFKPMRPVSENTEALKKAASQASIGYSGADIHAAITKAEARSRRIHD